MTKPPLWFWIAAILGALWEAIGCFFYWSEVSITPDALAALPDYSRYIIEQRPVWSTAGFAIGTWGGLFGMILLLLRKKLAEPVILISVIGTLVAYAWPFVSGRMSDLQPADKVLFVLIPVLQILLWLLARKARRAGWIG